MASTVLKEILAIPEGELAATPVEELEQFATALHRAKPSIAPVFNIANNILLEIEHGSWSTTAIRAMLEKMLTGEKQSGPLIAQFAVEEMKGDWLMTFSYSGTVREVLIALSKRRNIRVTVAESLPGGEGRQFAKLLSESGIEAEVIHDSTIIARMELVDAAITGADSLTPHGLVNKVGTRIMVEAHYGYLHKPASKRRRQIQGAGHDGPHCSGAVRGGGCRIRRDAHQRNDSVGCVQGADGRIEIIGQRARPWLKRHGLALYTQRYYLMIRLPSLTPQDSRITSAASRMR
jgi:hypothetical protein